MSARDAAFVIKLGLLECGVHDNASLTGKLAEARADQKAKDWLNTSAIIMLDRMDEAAKDRHKAAEFARELKQLLDSVPSMAG